jgi:hypothetical protein
MAECEVAAEGAGAETIEAESQEVVRNSEGRP